MSEKGSSEDASRFLERKTNKNDPLENTSKELLDLLSPKIRKAAEKFQPEDPRPEAEEPIKPKPVKSRRGKPKLPNSKP